MILTLYCYCFQIAVGCDFNLILLLFSNRRKNVTCFQMTDLEIKVFMNIGLERNSPTNIIWIKYRYTSPLIIATTITAFLKLVYRFYYLNIETEYTEFDITHYCM